MKETFFLQEKTLEALALAIDALDPETETLLSPVAVYSPAISKYYVACQREVVLNPEN